MARVFLKALLVEYEAGDVLGKVLAYFSVLPWLLAAGLIGFFVARRELRTLFFGLGLLLNHILNGIVKHQIREPRPQLVGTVDEIYGMPSNHSQMAFFFSTFLSLFILFGTTMQRHPVLPARLLPLVKAAACAGLVAMAVIIAHSRVYLHYHTRDQVVYGGIFGCALATGWYLLGAAVGGTLFPALERTLLARLLLIKDSTPIADVLVVEYEHQQGLKEALARRSTKRD